jgi:hypothetical protein
LIRAASAKVPFIEKVKSLLTICTRDKDSYDKQRHHIHPDLGSGFSFFNPGLYPLQANRDMKARMRRKGSLDQVGD